MVEAETGEATVPSGRAAGVVLGLCAVTSLVLLANHPGGEAHKLIDVLKSAAANRGADALVHGGFIAVLAAEFVCFTILAARLGSHRAVVLAAMVLTAIGFMATGGSMLIDGLVTPDVASRYAVAPPDRINEVRPVLVLIGSLIRFLMPLGLAFQGLGTLLWGAALWGKGGAARVVGLAGALIGAGAVAGLAATYDTLNPFVLMGGMGLLALWTLAVGVLLGTRRA